MQWPGLGAWAPVRLVMSAPCCWFRWSAVPRNSGQGVPLSQQIQRPGPHTLVPQPLESVGHHSPATLTSPPCFPPHTLRNHGPPRGVASSGWVRRPQHLRANLLLRRLSPTASRDVRAGPLGLDCPLTRPEWSFSPRSVLASSLAPCSLRGPPSPVASVAPSMGTSRCLSPAQGSPHALEAVGTSSGTVARGPDVSLDFLPHLVKLLCGRRHLGLQLL